MHNARLASRLILSDFSDFVNVNKLLVIRANTRHHHPRIASVAAAAAMSNELIGSRIIIISKQELRYEGLLRDLNPQDDTFLLADGTDPIAGFARGISMR